MMRCTTCGTEHDGKFCPNCGTPAGRETENLNETKEKAPKKPLWKRTWFRIVCVVVFLGILGNLFGGRTEVSPKPQAETAVQAGQEAAVSDEKVETPDEPEIPVQTTYVLCSGNYLAGVDIPTGRCDVTAVSGQGNLMSSNMFQGGVNAMFGIDDGTGLYSSSFKGLQLPKGVTLSTTGGLVIQLDFTEISAACPGRAYDEDSAFQLESGNYIAGTDFPIGIYKITAVSGQGNLSSSNIFNGGVNEMFGIDDGSGWYTPEIWNVVMEKNVQLSVSPGLTVRLIPAVFE